MPFGFPSEQAFSFTGIPTQLFLSREDAANNIEVFLLRRRLQKTSEPHLSEIGRRVGPELRPVVTKQEALFLHPDKSICSTVHMDAFKLRRATVAGN